MFIKGIYQEVYGGKEVKKVKVFSITNGNVAFSPNLNAEQADMMMPEKHTKEWYLVETLE